ncbi:MAG: type II toxin-antitoxin system RelE/ParE family toxin [Burkholderiales bacterium]|nr:MAG: type II toxin-antitoxin system RelE/ParE family toxin [Burkholderiales bacterium]
MDNLDEEAALIASEDPAAARLVVLRIVWAVAELREHPGIGGPGRLSGTRELAVPRPRYVVPYRVRGGAVEILRVFHTSRRPPGRW